MSKFTENILIQKKNQFAKIQFNSAKIKIINDSKMNKALLILLIACLWISDTTQSSLRFTRQNRNEQQPKGNQQGNGENNFNNGIIFPGFNHQPFWNPQPQFVGFPSYPLPTPNTFTSQGGVSSRTNVKKSSTSCTFVFDGKDTVKKCEST